MAQICRPAAGLPRPKPSEKWFFVVGRTSEWRMADGAREVNQTTQDTLTRKLKEETKMGVGTGGEHLNEQRGGRRS